MNTQPVPPQAWQPSPWQPPPPSPPRRKHRTRRALLAIGGSIALIITAVTIAVAASGPGNSAPVRLPGSGTVTFTPAPAQPAQPVTPVTPQFTIAQQQAIASAESYLHNEPGFSRKGLISQLDSKYGEGFSRKLAVFAVSHIKVNWFQQAVFSARSYMKNEPGWSYSGLVDQLHSPYGEQFTLRQAEYAAGKVGL